MATVSSITIAGAGLGGLAAAAGLLQAGFDVEVYEQAPELGEVGAGIQVSANGSRVLHHIGLADALGGVAVKPLSYNFRLHDTGEELQSFELGSQHESRFGAPYYQLHRADLHALLANRVEALKPGCIHLNSTIGSYRETAESVIAYFTNGSEVESDLLVGADGIKSAVRQQLVGPEEPHFTGQIAWRLLVPVSRLPEVFKQQRTYIWVGPRKHAVTYFVRSGELVNFVGCVDNEQWTAEGWTIRSPWEEMQADFEGWHPEIRSLIEAADRDACYRWALNNRPALQHWHGERVVLLGDSAHSTLPYMAQGAVMAIEDSAILVRALQRDLPLVDALALYVRNRLPRTTRIVNESSANAKLFHHHTEEDMRAAFEARGDIGRDRAQWLFSYDPLSVELI